MIAGEAPSEGRQKTVKICVGIRTHRFGQAERDLYESLSQYFSPEEIYILMDETKSPVSVQDPKYQKLSINKMNLRALSLHTEHHRLGWLCGDYPYYILRQQVSADYYWLIEPDVRFTYDDSGGFFGKFSGVFADFMAYGFRKKSKDWPWYRRVEMLSPQVYGCAFPVTRLSGRAIDFLLSERQKLRDLDPDSYPNDESFVSTVLMGAGFSCEPLERYSPDSFANFSVHHAYYWPEAARSLPRGLVVHSALDRENFYEKFGRMLSVNFRNGGMGLVLRAGGIGADDKDHVDRLREIFLKTASRWFDRQAQAGDVSADPPEQAAGPSVADLPHALGMRRLIRARKKGLFAYSSITDFKLGPPQQCRIDVELLKGYSPYCFLYDAGVFVLVDTPSDANAAPFFYQEQFKRATEVVRVPLAGLAKAFGGRRDLLEEDPVLIFSIGRCGSTLFSKLSGACGMVDYSEPDIFSGINGHKDDPRASTILRYASACLANAAGTTPSQLSIKFRSDSNAAIETFVRTFPRARYVFLTRNLRDWSASFISKFDWNNGQLMANLRRGARAQAVLEASGVAYSVLRYEDFGARPELVYQSLTGIPQVPDDVVHKLRSVATQDSQQGSGIGDKASSGAEVQRRVEQFLSHFQANVGEEVSGRYYIDP